MTINTGFYVRALADDGKWKSLDVGEMSATERDRWMQDLDHDRTRLWLATMLGWIRDNVKEESP